MMVFEVVVGLSLLCSCCSGLSSGSTTVGENEIGALIAKIAMMEDKVSKQELRIFDLEYTVNIQKYDITDLKSKFAEVQSRVQDIETRVLKLREILTRNIRNEPEIILKGTHVEPEISADSIVRHNYVHTADKRLLTPNLQLKQTRIGFYAYMSRNEDNPGKHHTLIFDVVKTQIGNGYNSFAGLFTAPIDGLYVFPYSITMVTNAYGSFEIIKNSGIARSLFVDAGNEDKWRHSSTTILLTLSKGDSVFVRTSATYTLRGDVHSDGNSRSSFAGWYIQ